VCARPLELHLELRRRAAALLGDGHAQRGEPAQTQVADDPLSGGRDGDAREGLRARDRVAVLVGLARSALATLRVDEYFTPG